MLVDATVCLRKIEKMAHTQVKVADELIEKARKKLNASSQTPACYVVDQALRDFLEAKSA